MLIESELLVCKDCLRRKNVGDPINFVDNRDFKKKTGKVVIYNHGWYKQKAVEYKMSNNKGMTETHIVFADYITIN